MGKQQEKVSKVRKVKDLKTKVRKDHHTGETQAGAILINPSAQRPKYEFEFVNDYVEIEGEAWVKVSDTLAPGNSAWVSNKGRIKSYTGVVTTGCLNKQGYKVVGIGGKNLKLHRVIMISFGIEQPSPEHKFVNHKDFNRSNNSLKNLEWCTHAENIQHSFSNNPDRRSNAALRSKPVRGRKDGEVEWLEYDSAHHAARELELTQGSISGSCRKGWKVKGYRFEFSDPKEPALLEGEVWKPLAASAGISNMGRYKDSRGIIKTPMPMDDGRCRVQIDGENLYVHVIVATCFLPPAGPGQTDVIHIDGNQSNNALSNLKWATRGENIQHSYDHLERKSNAESISKKVRARIVGSTEWQTYNSVTDASRVLGLASDTVSRACRRNATN